MKQKITIVDDDENLHSILHLMLAEEYELDHHTDINRLIPLQEPFPNLLLLDGQIGNSNGLDVCRQLKANPLTAHIPVIMISGRQDLALLAQEAGANAWLEKPFSIEALKHLVSHHLRNDSAKTSLLSPSQTVDSQV
jgi:DNA-binding response OmpR family regulator